MKMKVLLFWGKSRLTLSRPTLTNNEFICQGADEIHGDDDTKLCLHDQFDQEVVTTVR